MSNAWAIQFPNSSDSEDFQGSQCEYTKNTWMVEKKLAIARANCKGQLASKVRGERRLRHIVRSQQSQTLAQITNQLSDGTSRTISKWIVQHSLKRMGFGSSRPARVPLLNTRHRAALLAWARDHRDWTGKE
ncbi:HTH_Tnp_Tc3_2 domain-containing protein [Trichonephila clavipes]|nr:HTH_Tnp_Tc3_2 domain-containing protein [Trichonephila clavipes]